MLYNIPIKNYRKLRFGKIGVTSRHCTTKKFLGQNVNVKFFTVAPYLKVIFEMTVTKRAGNDTFH